MKRSIAAAVAAFVRDEHEMIKMHAGYAAACAGRSYRLTYVLGLVQLPIELLGYVAASNHCAMRGHDYVDHGYGGPESGCIDIQCERCGDRHFTRLY